MTTFGELVGHPCDTSTYQGAPEYPVRTAEEERLNGSMGAVISEVNISEPSDMVWDILADFGKVDTASPVVVTSRLTSDHQHGLGMTRECQLTIPGAVIHERVTGWREGEYLKVESFDGVRLPVKSMTMEFELQPIEGATVLRGTLEYVPLGGVFSWLLGPLFRPRIVTMIRLFLAGIRHRAETGEHVDRNVRVDTDSVAVLSS